MYRNIPPMYTQVYTCTGAHKMNCNGTLPNSLSELDRAYLHSNIESRDIETLKHDFSSVLSVLRCV